MQAEDLILDDTFIAWFEKTNQEHQDKWSEWIVNNPDQRPIVDQAVFMLESLRLQNVEVPHNLTLNARKRLMDSIEEWENNKIKTVPLYRRKAVLLVAAASVTILITSLILWLTNPFPKNYYATQRGETKDLVLPDGSKVTLNGNSKLTLSPHWKQHNVREVWLEGEGYFSVRHTKNHQGFIVHTGDLHVEVLGTEFNVKKRAERTEIVLTTGKIQLSTTDNQDAPPLVMKPGERVEYTTTARQLVKKEVNPTKYTSWKDGALIFEDASIQEVVQVLQESYGYVVDVNQEISTDKQFNGVFTSDDLDVLLAALSKVYNIEIKQTDKKITMRRNDREKK
jgi:transmembrane sensor